MSDSAREEGTAGVSDNGAASVPVGHGLDPDLAAAKARGAGTHRSAPAPVIDTRRYRWMIGIFGLTVVIVISVVGFLTRGIATTGVAAGHRLLYFAAPLATSDLNGSANVANPTCSLARHDARALNVCLLAKRAPLVLAFFVTGATACRREVDAMQTLSREFPTVGFAAVAVGASHADALRVVRSHGWTIPVAYDSANVVGEQYGVQICPLVELAYRGGIVQDRLIGDGWTTPAALSSRVRDLLSSAPR